MGVLVSMILVPFRRLLADKNAARAERIAAGEEVFPLSPGAVAVLVVVGFFVVPAVVTDIYSLVFG